MAAHGNENRFCTAGSNMTVFQLSLKIIIYIFLGLAARKLKVMPDGFDRMLTKFVMAIPLPCMIINSFLGFEFSIDELVTFPIIMGLAILLIAIAFVIGDFIYFRMGKTGVAKSVRYGLTFTNFTFFGFGVVSELYGAHIMLYYVIFTLPIRIMFYGGASVLLGNGSVRTNRKELLKRFFCEPVVAVLIGFFLYILQVPLPSLVTDVMGTLGNMASPLGLMLCGTIIADSEWKGVLKYPCVFWVTALRLLAMPAMALGVTRLLGVDPEICKAVIFYFAMPVASFLPTFCLRYNPNEREGRLAGSYMVVVSTLLCVITIPIWALILESLY